MRMQRVFTVMLLLALAAMPLSAQRHGGGGGGHVGMRGPSVGFSGHAGYGGGFHGGSRYSVGVGVGVGGARFGGYYGGTHYYGGHYTRGFYGGYYGPRYYGPRYSWGVGFYYGYPYASYWPYYSYSYPYPYAYYATPSYPVVYSSDANSQGAQQLSQDVNDLRSEVRDLRDTNDQLRYELEKRQTPQQPQTQSYRYPRPPVNQGKPTASEAPPTVIVFKDGQRIEANNYAMVGQTLWVLNSQQAQKYPLASLDVEESRRLNAERGIEFALPNR